MKLVTTHNIEIQDSAPYVAHYRQGSNERIPGTTYYVLWNNNYPHPGTTIKSVQYFR